MSDFCRTTAIKNVLDSVWLAAKIFTHKMVGLPTEVYANHYSKWFETHKKIQSLNIENERQRGYELNTPWRRQKSVSF